MISPDTSRLPSKIRDGIRVAESGCWEWSGPALPTGYGRVWTGTGREYTHRLVYELVVGPIPEGLTIDHLCRNPCCCNPDHLEPVTLAENVLRGDGLPARNARKTHCVRGHEFTPENTRIDPAGARICIACRSRGTGSGGPTTAEINAEKTHCPQGHPYDEENTYVRPGGSRDCRACRRESLRKWRQRRKALVTETKKASTGGSR